MTKNYKKVVWGKKIGNYRSEQYQDPYNDQ